MTDQSSQDGAQRRSSLWTEDQGPDGFLQRSSLLVQGLRKKDFERPVIGICSNTSDFNRCHAHFDGMIAAIRDSVLQCGGLPRVFNTMTMGADCIRPLGATFMHRNLLAMEIEQTILSYGMDGVVFLGACDETIPAMLMAAASVDLPSVLLPGGPAFNGHWRGRDVGSGHDAYRAFEAVARGELDASDIDDLELSLERSPGHCNVMGTASTMAVLAEAIGMAPVGSAAIPAVDSRRLAKARDTGELVMRLVADDLRPTQIMTAAAIDNAIRTLAAIDGSSNAVLHLLAIAGRLGIDLPRERFDQLSQDTPVLVNLAPSGEYYMEDFFNAGGGAALLNALSPLLDETAVTVTGRSLQEDAAAGRSADPRVVGTLAAPIAPPAGFVVLRGNIAPDGAIVRVGVASPHLLTHRGRAVVFESQAELEEQLYHPDFDIRADDVIVLRGEGPKGSAGMAGGNFIHVPDKLVREGVLDMVRISDTRMGGTTTGTAAIHVAPESAVGGPLGLVRTGDMICMDLGRRALDVELSDEELERRREQQSLPVLGPSRGFRRLFVESVTQADTGCDFDFLHATGSLPAPAPGSATSR
jgi:dihydroxy-acid dehydratase